MDKSHMVQVGEAVQREITRRVLEIITNERKRRKIWNKIKTFLSSIKRCRCMCGTSGVGCECERPVAFAPEWIQVHTTKTQDSLEVVGFTKVDPPTKTTLI